MERIQFSQPPTASPETFLEGQASFNCLGVNSRASQPQEPRDTLQGAQANVEPSVQQEHWQRFALQGSHTGLALPK